MQTLVPLALALTKYYADRKGCNELLETALVQLLKELALRARWWLESFGSTYAEVLKATVVTADEAGTTTTPWEPESLPKVLKMKGADMDKDEQDLFAIAHHFKSVLQVVEPEPSPICVAGMPPMSPNTICCAVSMARVATALATLRGVSKTAQYRQLDTNVQRLGEVADSLGRLRAVLKENLGDSDPVGSALYERELKRVKMVHGACMDGALCCMGAQVATTKALIKDPINVHKLVEESTGGIDGGALYKACTKGAEAKAFKKSFDAVAPLFTLHVDIAARLSMHQFDFNMDFLKVELPEQLKQDIQECKRAFGGLAVVQAIFEPKPSEKGGSQALIDAAKSAIAKLGFDEGDGHGMSPKVMLLLSSGVEEGAASAKPPLVKKK